MIDFQSGSMSQVDSDGLDDSLSSGMISREHLFRSL